EVFEDEHQVANGLGQVGILAVDVVEDFAAGGGVQPVEHFSHGAHTAVGFAAEFAERLQLLPDDAGDFKDNFRRDLIQAGHSLRDVRPHGGGQRSQQGRGLGVVEV